MYPVLALRPIGETRLCYHKRRRMGLETSGLASLVPNLDLLSEADKLWRTWVVLSLVS